MNWTEIRILYGRELRSALRERSIVINSILLPIFLYPVILWATFSGMTLVQGLSQGFVSRVVVAELPAGHEALRDSLDAGRNVELVPAGERSPAELVDAVRAGELDAVLEIVPADTEAGRLPGNFAARLSYDRAEDRSRRARDRVEVVLDRYREAWLRTEGERLGLSREALEQFRVQQNNVATGGQMGAFLLAEMLPVFLVIMVALGCFYPAIDSTAGERERSTWETLMSVSASRSSIVTAKYLYVATMGSAAGVLNVAAMTVSMGAIVRPIMSARTDTLAFSLPWTSIPIMVVGAVSLALFFAAAMMILASFARTFKDGQSMITPVYWLALVPILVTGGPDQALDPTMALIPLANVTLMIRDAITGIYDVPLIGLTLLAELTLVALCLFVARITLQFEDLLIGSYDGSFWQFARDRLFSRSQRKERAG